MHHASRGNGRGGRGYRGRGGRGRGGWGRGFRRGGPGDSGGFNNNGNPIGGNPATEGANGSANGGRIDAQARRPMRGYYLPEQIFQHFNPKATSCDRAQLGTINAGEDKPDAIAYALIHTANQMDWMDDNTLYIKSHLDLLPGYAEKKAVLVANHQELDHEQVMDGISARLTETIKFGHYGIEDGPDIECFDENGSISSVVVPGDWMPESFELPKAATVSTPSVQYAPDHHAPFAVYARNGNNPDKNGFKFIAWFFVEKIELFAANSVALARKMQAKKWEADMTREWAVTKLQKIERGEPEWRFEPRINLDLFTRHGINHPDGRPAATCTTAQPPKDESTPKELAAHFVGALMNDLEKSLPSQDNDFEGKMRQIMGMAPEEVTPALFVEALEGVAPERFAEALGGIAPELVAEAFGPAEGMAAEAGNDAGNDATNGCDKEQHDATNGGDKEQHDDTDGGDKERRDATNGGDQEQHDIAKKDQQLPPQDDNRGPVLPPGFPVELFRDIGIQDEGWENFDKSPANGGGAAKADILIVNESQTQGEKKEADGEAEKNVEKDAKADILIVKEGQDHAEKKEADGETKKNAEKDAEKDVEQDVEQDAEKDVEQDVEQDAEKDVEQDVEQDAEQEAAKDAEKVANGVTKEAANGEIKEEANGETKETKEEENGEKKEEAWQGEIKQEPFRILRLL